MWWKILLLTNSSVWMRLAIFIQCGLFFWKMLPLERTKISDTFVNHQSLKYFSDNLFQEKLYVDINKIVEVSIGSIKIIQILVSFTTIVK